MTTVENPVLPILREAADEWRRRHQVRIALRQFDVWTEEIMLAVGAPLWRLWRRATGKGDG